MEWFKPYEHELLEVFAECRIRIDGFLPPLNDIGLQYMRKFDVFQQGSAKNYICYLLPFWMKDQTSLSPDVYRSLSAANIFGMLYFFIQDDIMDTHPKDSIPGMWKHQLVLANLLYTEFIHIYLDFFPSHHPFWSYFRSYIQDWSEGVIHESQHNYFHHNPIHISKKAAPVKLGSTAVLLLADRHDLVEEAADLLNNVLLTLQMMDDWADYEQDLADGSYNCLLSLIQSVNNLPHNYRLNTEEVQRAIYLYEVLDSYADIASATHSRILNSSLNAPHVISFHKALLDELLIEAEHIKNGRKMLERGGLNYYLSILSKI
ncbi:class 1 isoprenoid biosynthesis enzyme [Paenibacillus dakarensis]|uniref:class 1 isoprenoid biosynthesis enzyme n=1 Tax=Paenibacillus dakarensis TaxID=1527293 RepID=UPI0006D5729D|nr:class 1 isoprenoid biosynthesis enzyme [Paenibacillus dakarensis]